MVNVKEKQKETYENEVGRKFERKKQFDKHEACEVENR